MLRTPAPQGRQLPQEEVWSQQPAEAQEEDQELRCVAANQFHRPFKSTVVVVYRMLCCVVLLSGC